MDHKGRMKRARRFKRIHMRVSDVLDNYLEIGASFLKWCKHSDVHNHWSMLFAQLWFIDCPCCLFYRGVTFGIALSMSAAAFIFGILYLIGA